ncbi:MULTISPECIES: lipopolysaccharide biosynthesis protein [Aerococcus]|uniref:Uncharacterized protein n=2 Tax=Aerococcus TaxID=1375 RepID=A0A2I1L4U7_9LACT|nr:MULTISPECIES: hypothetical protein [Aerococcus]KAA9218298.1 hypothetical protein F6I39_07440 [Aerococcus loyolae]MCY3026444.1 hypothetical protein [Aerococcus loyolae]MCY3029863.1 hypothetical protein [Aerococcus loyolae]MDK6258646.1 hypothetical protein [Aerococcus urinae]MDK6294488.1 hypothetical protein [Aerococcus urinae]
MNNLIKIIYYRLMILFSQSKFFLVDSSLNILASLLLTASTQLFIYPLLSRYYDAYEYGTILTSMGLINAIGVTLGSTINNTRLLAQKKYEKKQLLGDFNNIFYASSLLIFLFSFILYVFNKNSIWIGILIFFTSFRSYFTVEYRIIINYKKTLINNFVTCIGYLLGIIWLIYLKNWYLIFLTGEIFSAVYLLCSTSIIRDPLRKTIYFKDTIKSYLFYLTANSLANFMLYMDRFLIFPILGSQIVSVYTAASFLGKTAGIVMGPISGVLLSYYSKEDYIDKRAFWKRLVIFSIIAFAFFIMIVTIGYPVTYMLYPTLFGKAKQYFVIANLGVIILILGNTVQPTLLRFCHPRWSLVIQVIYLIFYLLFATLLSQKHGLFGFCLGVLLANILRLIIMVLIINHSISQTRRENY